jgi:hypothetical protein
MIAFDATQAAIVAAATKTVTWLFVVTAASAQVHYWSTKAYTFGGQAYTFGVLPDSFDGVTLNRAKSELGIQAPSDLSFAVTNKGDVLSAADFIDGSVLLKLVIKAGASEAVIRQWKFRIRDAISVYQKMTLTCEDYLQAFLAGDYPNTPFVKSTFFGSDTARESDNVCVPVPFGVCYVPLRSVYIGGAVSLSGTTFSAVASANGSRCLIDDSAAGFAGVEVGRIVTVAGFAHPENNGAFQVLGRAAGTLELSKDAGLVTEAAGGAVTITMGSRYYLLGPSDRAYTIDRVRSPRDCGVKSEWTSAGGYAFVQSAQTDPGGTAWKVFQPIIADVDCDGTPDAPGFWRSGDVFLDMPTMFSRDDTASLTNPADVIEFVLKDMGAVAGDLDAASFAAAKAVYASWGLSFAGAFWYKEPRAKVLSRLLTMCHSYLTFTDKIGLAVRSKTSRATITRSHVLRQGDSTGAFAYRGSSLKGLSDCGHVAWQPAGEAQDKFLTVLVPVKSTRSVISRESIEATFVQDSQDAQRIGTLHYQRLLAKVADVDFPAKATLLKLEPEDVISIGVGDYGGSYDVMIDRLQITRDLTLKIGAIRYAVALDDWTDLSPAAITVYDEDTSQLWQPPVSGPLSDAPLGTASYDAWGAEYLVVAPVANQGRYLHIQDALNALPASGGAIFLKNGTYTHDAPIYVPDKDLDLVGESQGGVILRNQPGWNLFEFASLTKSFSLSDCTIQSRNTVAWTRMISITGESAGSFAFARLTLKLADQGMASCNGDYGIYEIDGTENRIVTIDDLTVNDGMTAICSQNPSLAKIAIRGGRYVDQKNYGIIVYCRYYQIVGAQLFDQRMTGIACLSTTSEQNQVTDCKVFLIPAGGHSTIIAYLLQHGENLAVSGNVAFADLSSLNQHVCGFYVAGTRNQVIGNNVYIKHVSDQGSRGISVQDEGGFNKVSQNIILINNTDNSSAYKMGITLSTADDNDIGSNAIYMTNSGAKDVGVFIYAGSDRNYGRNNAAYNVLAGMDVLDYGADNTVNVMDGGAF